MPWWPEAAKYTIHNGLLLLAANIYQCRPTAATVTCHENLTAIFTIQEQVYVVRQTLTALSDLSLILHLRLFRLCSEDEEDNKFKTINFLLYCKRKNHMMTSCAPGKDSSFFGFWCTGWQCHEEFYVFQKPQQKSSETHFLFISTYLHATKVKQILCCAFSGL